jgi:lipoprotein NlpI
MTAYEFLLRGLEYHRLGGVTEEYTRKAVYWFERAIEADPNFARPRAMLVCATSGLPEFDLDEGIRSVERALELDPNEPEANRIMGSIKMLIGEFDAARQYHEKAMSISPSDAYIKARSAAYYNFVGESERALELLDEAGELDPFLPVWCVEERGAALYALDRFEEAIEASRGLPFQTWRSRIYRAASRAALGKIDRARRIIAEAVASAPDLTTEYVRQHETYRDPEVTRTLIERLTAAGLRQGASVVAS